VRLPGRITVLYFQPHEQLSTFRALLATRFDCVGRHAFSISGGLISVELLPSLSFVECRLTDNGVGKANTYPGRELKILEALAKNLGGTIDQRFGPLRRNSGPDFSN
jgi:hypothetical protein